MPAVRFLAAFAFSLVSALAFAQAEKAKPYEPTSGQAGKDVVWVPTPQVLVDRMMEMAKVTPQDYVMDLGSGDGRTVITAAKRGATAMGVEYNPDMVELSKINAQKEGVTAKATFMKADLFETDFSKATVITMFLLPSINLKLRPKILSLKPGTRVVSNSFNMDTWDPDRTDQLTITDGCDAGWCTAHLWIVPDKFEGTYRIPEGELKLEQRFQVLSGTLKTATGSHVVKGKVNGYEAAFNADGRNYRAKMNGKELQIIRP